MFRHVVRISALAVPAALLAAALATPVSAIPAWTRAHGVECAKCHVAGFKLSKMGQEFLRSGHRIEDTKDAGNLSHHLSVAQKSRYNWSKKINEDGTSKSVVNSFEQHALSLYMGGPIDKNWSYFAELYWHENSGSTSGSSDLNDYGRSKLADAYIHYTHRYDEKSYSSMRFGQFSPLLLHMHGVGARLDQDRAYVINSGTVGDNPYKPFQRQFGVEVAYGNSGVTGTVAMVNGTGGKLFNRVDNDLKKDVYATLDYGFGEEGSMIGLYAYKGHYPLAVDNSFKYAPQSYDEFQQLGVLGNYTMKQGALIGAFFNGQNEYVLRKDFAGPADTANVVVEPKSMGYYVEGQFYASPKWIPYARYDFWDPDTDIEDNDIKGFMLGLSWWAMENGRFVGQFSQMKTANANPDKVATENKFTLEVNFMY